MTLTVPITLENLVSNIARMKKSSTATVTWKRNKPTRKKWYLKETNDPCHQIITIQKLYTQDDYCIHNIEHGYVNSEDEYSAQVTSHPQESHDTGEPGVQHFQDEERLHSNCDMKEKPTRKKTDLKETNDPGHQNITVHELSAQDDKCMLIVLQRRQKKRNPEKQPNDPGHQNIMVQELYTQDNKCSHNNNEHR